MKFDKKLLLIIFSCYFSTVAAQRQMEYLDRGLVAVTTQRGHIAVSWRLLATDHPQTSFNLYRSSQGKVVRLNPAPLSASTFFTDSATQISLDNRYYVRAVVKGNEQQKSAEFLVKANAPNYLSVPLQTPAGYAPNDASVGDLDGDGSYEIILHQTGTGHDNSHSGITDPPIFQAYKMDGTLLWTINLGINIREGAHYTQFMVYDLDGDGKAELAMKTADGSRDGKGKIIGEGARDWRNASGYILAGPEYLTIFDGLTGAALFTTAYLPPRHPDTSAPSSDQLKKLWGDGYGNRMDRFLAGVAYLDGKNPSLIMARGYYTRTVIAAWDFKDKKLTSRWVFDTEDGTAGNKAYRGQGNHSLSIADVDQDGKDEIVYGAMVVDDNGKGLYSTGLGHGDALHVSDLDPERPGLEVFDIQERFDDAGAHFRDAKTGENLWKKASVKSGDDGEGPGRGLALNIDPRYAGSECWVAGAGITGIFDRKGNRIADKTPPCNMGIYWDGDLLSELLNGTAVYKWDYLQEKTSVLLSAVGCIANNGTKATPVLSADLFGDWREEVIYGTADHRELRIFTTDIPTKHRLYTFMHNPQYRLSIAWQNVAYNQPPHTDYYIDETMHMPALPNLKIIKATKR
ncbi:rhamnogalacturonan lyase [Pedobacter metabolipauper]|uniref:Rhamnogalacturonan endolyase n=1 Tax=Pedobacter metabolipauper TaxID=425513 RepID=A0A4R6SVU0_9SPHI|nr:rhamnogalacturonan lyase [Pedobacter metabolipauper]TDQ08900.1 rhamnogalacturonan endolyase [Pedobacter metabolipauper]